MAHSSLKDIKKKLDAAAEKEFDELKKKIPGVQAPTFYLLFFQFTRSGDFVKQLPPGTAVGPNLRGSFFSQLLSPEEDEEALVLIQEHNGKKTCNETDNHSQEAGQKTERDDRTSMYAQCLKRKKQEPFLSKDAYPLWHVGSEEERKAIEMALYEHLEQPLKKDNLITSDYDYARQLMKKANTTFVDEKDWCQDKDGKWKRKKRGCYFQVWKNGKPTKSWEWENIKWESCNLKQFENGFETGWPPQEESSFVTMPWNPMPPQFLYGAMEQFPMPGAFMMPQMGWPQPVQTLPMGEPTQLSPRYVKPGPSAREKPLLHIKLPIGEVIRVYFEDFDQVTFKNIKKSC